MLDWKEILIRLGAAALLGALIGLERERKHLAAGLRTHMMVCVGACLIMIVSAFGFSDIIYSQHVSLDPSRIAAQVVSGIGFIGAGTILLLKQNSIRGLTTAAGLWTVAAIGLAIGGGLYFAAVAATIIALLILWALQPIEKIYLRKIRGNHLIITASFHALNFETINEMLTKYGIHVQSFHYEKSEQEISFEIQFVKNDSTKMETILNELKQNPAITEVQWT